MHMHPDRNHLIKIDHNKCFLIFEDQIWNDILPGKYLFRTNKFELIINFKIQLFGIREQYAKTIFQEPPKNYYNSKLLESEGNLKSGLIINNPNDGEKNYLKSKYIEQNKPTILIYFDYETSSTNFHPFAVSFMCKSYFLDNSDLFLREITKKFVFQYFSYMDIDNNFGKFTIEGIHEFNCFLDITSPIEENTSELVTIVDVEAHEKYNAAQNSGEYQTENDTQNDIVVAFILYFFTLLSLMDNTKKTQIIFMAHNGSRFDFVLTFKILFHFLVKIIHQDNFTKFMYFQNQGRIVGMDFTFKKNIIISFRDSILFVPTLNKSLKGATKELKLPLNKAENFYKIMDFISLKLRVCLDWNELIHNELSQYLWDYFLDIDQVFFELEKCKINENTTLKELFDCQLVEYVKYDVLVLKQLMEYIMINVILPNFKYLQGDISRLVSERSITALAYNEYTFTLSQKIQCLYFPTEEQREFIGESVYGGRCTGTLIGKYKHLQQDHGVYFIDIPEIIMDIWQKWPETTNFKIFLEFIRKNYQDLRQTYGPNIEVFFLGIFLHVDICSMYPSALNSPFPIGPIKPLSIGNINEIQTSLNNKTFHVFKYPPFFVYAKVSSDKTLVREALLDCNKHGYLNYSSCPYHVKDKKKKTTEFIGGQNGGLHFVVGENIEGYYNSVDIYNMMVESFQIEILSVKSNDKFLNGYYFVGGWHDCVQSEYFEEKFLLKKNAKTPGDKFAAKVVLNGTYGKMITELLNKMTHFLNKLQTNMKGENVQEIISTSFDPLTGQKNLEAEKVYISSVPNKNFKSSENKKMAQCGSYCLALTRTMYAQMRNMIMEGIDIYQKSQNYKIKGYLGYSDTDAQTASFIGVCLGIPDKYFNEDLGKLNTTTIQYDFGLVAETCKGEYPHCPSLYEGWPCFFIPMTCAKKFYIETCMFCRNIKFRAKGHSAEDMDKVKDLNKLIRIFKTIDYKTNLIIQQLKKEYSLIDSTFKCMNKYNMFQVEIPICILNDVLLFGMDDSSWSFEKHLINCKYQHFIDSKNIKKKWTTVLQSLSSSRTTLSVSLFKGADSNKNPGFAKAKSFTIQTGLIKRKIFVCQVASYLPCDNCEEMIQSWFDPKINLNFNIY